MRFWSERFPYLREFARSHRVLHAGPGHEAELGITVDRNPLVKPDVIADLNKSLPFRAGSFDAIYAFSVLEHLEGFFEVMAEFHRILRPGGFVAILTPHFSNDASFVDPSHRLHLSSRSFDYLIGGSGLERDYGFYASARFSIRIRLLMLEPPWNRLPWLQRIVNRFPSTYERLFCYVVRGRGVYVELVATK